MQLKSESEYDKKISKYFEKFLLSTKLFLGPRAKRAVNIHNNNIQDQKVACLKQKKSISCRPYFQGLLQKIKIYVQTLSLIFLISYFLLELEFPKNIEERKVLLEVHF